VKPQGPARGFDFDISKVEHIFDLLLKEKQLKLPEGHKIPTVQEMNGRPYFKWHHSFTHTTNDCKGLRKQIQSAIEQGRLIFSQFAMKVDTHPFPSVNMVELGHPVQRQPGFSSPLLLKERERQIQIILTIQSRKPPAQIYLKTSVRRPRPTSHDNSETRAKE
jgi:hypothetical protein